MLLPLSELLLRLTEELLDDTLAEELLTELRGLLGNEALLTLPALLDELLEELRQQQSPTIS